MNTKLRLVLAALALGGTMGVATQAHAVFVRTAVAYRPIGFHPVARAAVATTAVAATAIAVGTMVHSIPPSCTSVSVAGGIYQQCGNTWYQPRYAGSQVNYVVVNPPQ